MKKLSVYFLIAATTTMYGCSIIEKAQDIIIPDETEIQRAVTEQREVSVVCNRNNIKDYMDKGWVIVKTEERDVPCTWKTKKSKKGCNLELDKGCRLTVPDKMGKETIYFLERDSTI